MRLLHTQTHELKFFTGFNDPSNPRRPLSYAILSHTWGDDEVLFADIVSQSQDWKQKAGA